MDATLFNLLNSEDPLAEQQRLAATERDEVLDYLQRQQDRKDAIENSCKEEPFVPLGGELHNATPPNTTIIHETPRHRNIVFLSVRGFRLQEISEMTGMSVVWISQILRQPWARKVQLKLMSDGHKQAIDVLVQAAPEAYQTMVDMMRDPATPKPVKLKACTEIVDRVDGKPVQELKIDSRQHISYGTPEEIDAEMARINEEIKHAMGTN